MPSQDCQTFFCEPCNYTTERKSSFTKHLLTNKHRNQNNSTQSKKIEAVSSEGPPVCIWCGKIYANRSGLWKHQPKCSMYNKQVTSNSNGVQRQTSNIESTNRDSISHNVLAQMLDYFRESEKKHDEHRVMMERQLIAEREQCKKLINTVQDMIPKLGSYNNNNININVFLQEHCKDALNLKDFVASLQIELNDVTRFQDRSVLDAVGNVFVNGLRQLDLYKRPIHCTDLSLETLYIKENGNWENEHEGRGKLRGALTAVAAKQSKVLAEWERAHPEWNKNEELTNEYLRLVRVTTHPIEENSQDENRIIHSIAREVVVDIPKG